MLKFFTTLIVLFSINITCINAQLADGEIGPDFTLTDINGNEHNLYEVLAEGKTVIIDFFATWCGPCWSFHQTHVLADIYEQYGPNGTDEIYVYAIESDSGTNLDCLYGQTGCNDTSIGDWVEGVPYPIIDDRRTFNDYQNTYYPTVMMIYPDRTVSEIPFGQRTVADIVSRRDAGPKLSQGINAAFLEVETAAKSACKTLDFTPKYLIFNQGEETITSADISVTMNGETIYEEQWTGNVTPWGIVKDLELAELTINTNSAIEMKMENINGDASAILTHTSETLTDVSNSIIVYVKTGPDAAVDENRFEILNIFGRKVVSEDLNIPNNEYTFNISLEDLNCHILTIFDKGNNGIQGELEIKDDLGHIIFNNPDFDDAESVIFNSSQNTNTNELLSNVELALSPNPTSDLLDITMDLEETMNLNITLSSVNGAVVLNNGSKNYSAGKNSLQLDLSTLNQGMYLLNINEGNKQLTRKVIKL